MQDSSRPTSLMPLVSVTVTAPIRVNILTEFPIRRLPPDNAFKPKTLRGRLDSGVGRNCRIGSDKAELVHRAAPGVFVPVDDASWK